MAEQWEVRLNKANKKTMDLERYRDAVVAELVELKAERSECMDIRECSRGKAVNDRFIFIRDRQQSIRVAVYLGDEKPVWRRVHVLFRHSLVVKLVAYPLVDIIQLWDGLFRCVFPRDPSSS